jgi:predicted N-acyltransferase
MEIEITDTIEDMNEKEWNTFVGPEYIERSHAWYRNVEDSGARRMHYIFLRENGRLAAAACSYEYRERLHSLEIPFLEVKSPLGFSRAFFSRSPEHTAMLIRALAQIRKKEEAIAQSIFCLKKDEFNSSRSQVKGFVGLPMNDNTCIDLHFTDFEDYLNSLDAKARRSVRINLNKAQKSNVKPLFTSEFSQWKAVAHRLQKYIGEQYNDYRWPGAKRTKKIFLTK